MWGAADPGEVKLTWSQELGGFDGEDVRSALDAMRTTNVDFPPTLFQFVAMCRESRIRRSRSTEKLPPPRPNAEEARAALANIRRLMAARQA